MKLAIYCQKKLASLTFREYVRRRIQLAVERFSSRVRDVTVRIVDENGPRGGLDKVVRVTATLQQGRTIAIAARGAEAYATADDVADRLKSVLSRLSGRRRREKLWQGM